MLVTNPMFFMARFVAVCLLVLAAAYAGGAAKRPVFDIDAVDNLATMDPVGLNDDGSAVLRAQILLDRAHFSVGEIDGVF